MQITGTTFTGCTLGPYVDPYVFTGTANNLIGVDYSPINSFTNTVNYQIGLTYSPVNSFYSGVNNQISINIRGA